MAVTLFTDRRMLDHRVPPGIPSGRSGCRRFCAISSAPAISLPAPARPVREATADELARVHPADYLRRVAELEAAGGGMLDPDTWVSPDRTWRPGWPPARASRRSRLCLGEPTDEPCAWSARRDIMPGRPRGWVLHLRQRRPRRRRSPRPLRRQPNLDRRFRRPSRQWHPGDLLRLGPRRVPVDSSLSVLSRERGARRDRHGRGTWLHDEHPPALWHAADASTTRRFVRASSNWPTAFEPELVLISAGFDAHAEDPVGDLGLEVEDFEILTKETRRGGEDPRRGPDRQRARGGLQRADPGRMRSPLISMRSAPKPGRVEPRRLADEAGLESSVYRRRTE